MPKGYKGDVTWYVKGRKKPIAYSTVADKEIFDDLVEEHNGDLKLILESCRYSHDLKIIIQKYLDLGVTNVYADRV